MESPYPSKKFELRHNVENLILGVDSSAVITEDTGRVKKKKDKKKRVLGQSEVVKSEEELQARTKAAIQKETEDREVNYDKRGRKSLGVRIREKFATTFYGATPESQPMSALDKLIEKERAEKKAQEAQQT